MLLGLPLKKMRLNKAAFLIGVGMFTLMVFVSPFFDNDGSYSLFLNCNNKYVYPWRFLYVWFTDCIAAFASILLIMYEKRFVTDKGRLRLARKMDIDNLTKEIVKKQQDKKQQSFIESSKGSETDLQRFATFTVCSHRAQTRSMKIKSRPSAGSTLRDTAVN